MFNLKKVDFIWINRDQKSFEWFVNLLSQLEAEQQERSAGIHALAQRRKRQVIPEFLACHMGFSSTWINGALAEHTAPRPRSPREPWKAAA